MSHSPLQRLPPRSQTERVLDRIEGCFDRWFGPRLNPWRHLGALGFFLFWIVAASGLYVYALFDTSASGAYSSVEYMTREQWYAGGLMRSLHRYASDAFVVVMLLHARADGSRPCARLPVVLVGNRRAADLVRLCVRRWGVLVGVGSARAVLPHRHDGMARLAADLRRTADSQLPHAREHRRPLLLATHLPAHRHPARPPRGACGFTSSASAGR